MSRARLDAAICAFPYRERYSGKSKPRLIYRCGGSAGFVADIWYAYRVCMSRADRISGPRKHIASRPRRHVASDAPASRFTPKKEAPELVSPDKRGQGDFNVGWGGVNGFFGGAGIGCAGHPFLQPSSSNDIFRPRKAWLRNNRLRGSLRVGTVSIDLVA